MSTMSEAELAHLLAGGDILEKDGYGPKVARLEGERYLKLFYHKSWFSMSRLVSRAQRFATNAARLQRRGICTVAIERVFRLTHPVRHGVLYRGVAGTTAREALRASADRAGLSRELGAYIAQLHERGVLFRSLHMGNIIVQADGALALIDIADLRAHWFSLNRWQRRRNFHHVLRYASDKELLDLAAFSAGYCAALGRPDDATRLQQLLAGIAPQTRR